MADATPAPIAIDPQLIAAIATAVAQALKATSGPQFSMEELGETIGQAVAKGIGETTRRKVTIGEYRMTGHSQFHPKPLAETPKLKRACWQNGFYMNETTLFDDEVSLLNKITHSGRYIDRLVEVGIRGEGTATEEVYITFPNKDMNDQMMMRDHCPAGPGKFFIKMLEMITEAQAEERAEKEEQEAAKKAKPRQAFSTQATREARERAGA